MTIPDKLKFTKEHEWIQLDGDIATVGITDFAQGELGEIVYVEVESVGETIEKDEIFGTVEAVKTTSDLFMPLAGEVIEFNSKLDENGEDEPGLINTDPYGEGWVIKIKVADVASFDQLLDAEAYKSLVS